MPLMPAIRRVALCIAVSLSAARPGMLRRPCSWKSHTAFLEP